ncbi:hypothetical protein ABZ845_18530 [Streptomyces sp. NPDC047022]|uniref:hypothetical protein n=1 Tax=Streptomyces sp. NPDC047022 TaxID=3155737 RepID=UPI00340170E6
MSTPTAPARRRPHGLTDGTITSARHAGRRHHPLGTGPEARIPVLRLAGDADDAGLEPHICRSID